jgi:hypothetical protein
LGHGNKFLLFGRQFNWILYLFINFIYVNQDDFNRNCRKMSF